MNSKRACFFVLFLLIAAAFLPARGKKEIAPPPAPVVQVSGVVRLVGSGLFTELVISSPDGEWYIAKEDAIILKEMQHQAVTVEGEESVTELKFASGLSAGLRRELRNVKIIAE